MDVRRAWDIRGAARGAARGTVRGGAAALAVAALVVPVTGQAQAAAGPANDSRTSAVRLAAAPSSWEGDTSGATAERTDPVPTCSDRLAATTWHTFTADATGSLLLGVTTGGWEPTVAVFPVRADGTPGTGTWCSLGGPTALDVVAGRRYLVAVGVTGGASAGGTYRLALDHAPAAPEISLRVDPAATLRSGKAVVSGTYRCTGGVDPRDEYAVVEFTGGTLRQRGATVATYHLDGTLALCDGEEHPWAARTGSTRAVPGPTVVTLAGTVCTAHACGAGSVRATTTLARAR